MKNALIALTLLCLTGCTSLPKGVTPVSDFELPRYLGTWYEIARLDHRFERGLTHVTAEYQMRSDGGVSVTNSGFDTDKSRWETATGKAYFVDDPTTGHLKVSFFGPFYGSYAVFGLDTDAYQYAYVSGPDTDFLWLLSRTPTVSKEIMAAFRRSAEDKGFDLAELIEADQANPPPK